MPSRPARLSRPSFLLAVGAVAALMVLVGLVFLARATRTEARERFFEQYNRQQLVLAHQAARTIQELFGSFHRNLNLTARLLKDVRISPHDTRAIGRELQKVYDGIADAPVVELVVFDRRGTAVGIAPWEPSTVGRDYSWREYYQWARDRGSPGEMYLSPFMELAGGKALGIRGLIAATGLYGDDGTFRGVVGLVIDFDELARRHVLSIRIGEQGYAWLMDNNNRSILVDPRKRVSGLTFEQAFLPRWPKLYSLAQETQSGKPGMDWYDFEDPGDTRRATRKLVAYAPIRIGTRLWTLGVCTPMRNVERLIGSLLHRQAVLAATGAAVTLCGALALFALLLTWNRSLRREVAERTRDLGERTRDLSVAREKLESTFEELLASRKLAALGRLALGLAHEIRNPLFSIRMNMQMIRRKIRPTGSVDESFAIVEEEVQRLNRLLNHVMGFARPVPLRLEPTDAGDLVRKVLLLLNGRFDDDGVEVRADTGGAPTVVCDPEQIRQVLLNLALNAIEAMSDVSRPRRLTLALASDKDFLSIRVADSGRGILPEDLEKLFDPFFTTKAQGGGLGLSIAQAIVLRHGGGIEVESAVGEGTSFLVRLPLAGPSASAVEPARGADDSTSGEEAP